MERALAHRRLPHDLERARSGGAAGVKWSLSLPPAHWIVQLGKTNVIAQVNMYRNLIYLLLLLGTLDLGRATATTISLRQAAGGSQFSVELGVKLELEVVVDTEGEDLTGYTFFIAFDADHPMLSKFRPVGYDVTIL